MARLERRQSLARVGATCYRTRQPARNLEQPAIVTEHEVRPMSNSSNHATHKDRAKCAITGRERNKRDLVNFDHIRPALAERIRRDHPDIDEHALIDPDELARYRAIYVEDLLKAETGDIDEIDRRVAESMARNETLAQNIESEYAERRSLGETMSDHLASFGGSWSFLIAFAGFLAVWMAINIALGADRAFDNYPFILLNLVLSTIAAIQAPIIMMSQKRQEAKDRLRSFNDYQVNLKAELEIRHLHEKIDHLISKQFQRLAEIQQVQLEIMNEKRTRKGEG